MAGSTSTKTTEKKKTKSAAGKKTLVIVESPSKAKTIGKFLGSNYKVIASVGHVRDLPRSSLGIDIEQNFEPKYIAIRGKGDLIKSLKKEAKAAGKILLATDPDREGEAISWHLAFLLGMDPKEKCRIEFHEITKEAIKNAIKEPREIRLNMVDAQQARRVLDRLVGYQISPLLWRKVARGLSAGRVQSAALKIICDRENEIRNFIPAEYWTITAGFSKKEGKSSKKFTALLEEYNGKKISTDKKFKDITLVNEADAKKVVDALAKGKYTVKSVEEKESPKKPYAPFTTSSLQQEASYKLNFNTRKTMMVAQQLYEGIDIKGHGTMGLVSYIRTDSVRVSDEAREAAKNYIFENFGKEYWGNNVFSNKKKAVQDAHEAIRPSHIELIPEGIKDSLSPDQFALYNLIWCRFMASQMSAAVYKRVSAKIENSGYILGARGSKLIFDGYNRIYKATDDESKDNLLPNLEEGEELTAQEVKPEQKFTQPPDRFTEAMLIRTLEEKGIGRPSTYAPIVSTLTERRYVKKEKKALVPTDLGFVVIDMLSEYFKEIVDAGFTSDMEEKLDSIEEQGADWRNIVSDFYGPLSKELEYADQKIEKVKLEDTLTGEMCEKCGKPLAIKHGRFGDFIACTGFPDCRFTKKIQKTVGVKCPVCGKDILEKKGKKGRIFYGCSGYPDCQKAYWYKPTNKKCPKCGELLVEHKVKGKTLECPNENCDYTE